MKDKQKKLLDPLELLAAMDTQLPNKSEQIGIKNGVSMLFIHMGRYNKKIS